MELLIILILILINGVFSMSEIAIVSSRKARLEIAAKRGDKRAQAALETANNPNRFLSTVQIGITLIGILTGIFSGESMTEDFKSFFLSVEILAPYSQTLAVVSVVIIITFFSLVLGELVPKRIGLTNPEGIAKAVAQPMKWLTAITSPFVWLLTMTSDLLLKIFRIKPSTDSKITEEEIKAIIQEGKEGGEIQEIEQDIVERVFTLGDRNVSSLMTHRNDLLFLHVNMTAKDLQDTVSNELHSKYPVLDADEVQVIGIVTLKDLFMHINDEGFNLTDYLKEPQYIPENLGAFETLKTFKLSNIHFGIVVDEFGDTQGVVTMNDLLEALVGDVSEFYSEQFTFLEREDGSWLIDGQYPLAEFLSRFDLEGMISEIPYSTVSGLILHELRTLPVAGQKVQWLNFEFEVVDMDKARIDKVILKKLEQ
jgi:putative hemolysin